MPMNMAIEHSGIKIIADSMKTRLIDMELVYANKPHRKKKSIKGGSTGKQDGTTSNVSNTSNSNVKNTKTKPIVPYKQVIIAINVHFSMRNQGAKYLFLMLYFFVAITVKSDLFTH